MKLNKFFNKKIIIYIFTALLVISNIVCIYKIHALEEHSKKMDTDNIAETAVDSFKVGLEIIANVNGGEYTQNIFQAYDSVLVFESVMGWCGYTPVYMRNTDISDRMSDTSPHTNQLDSELRLIKNICRALYKDSENDKQVLEADSDIMNDYNYYRVYDFCRYCLDYLNRNDVNSCDSFEAMLNDVDTWCMENIPEE